jgi:D-serine deaminase-like pyridoxal phosphate-dependent protein
MLIERLDLTPGDMIETERLRGNLEAMQSVARKRPAKARELRAAINAAVKALADIAMRYEV